ncbi:MAG: hypothetical protein PHR82_04030 [Endomicrobiaceae bacterium]|nr:hypothetical protein [Endomicrobiaceae bacterium]
MSCDKDNKSCSFVNLISIAVVSMSVFVILLSVFSKNKQTLQDRLRSVYDGLSPQDYE